MAGTRFSTLEVNMQNFQIIFSITVGDNKKKTYKLNGRILTCSRHTLTAHLALNNNLLRQNEIACFKKH
jgi:hypothetical protein